jgi:hypothetical protein
MPAMSTVFRFLSAVVLTSHFLIPESSNLVDSMYGQSHVHNS